MLVFLSIWHNFLVSTESCQHVLLEISIVPDNTYSSFFYTRHYKYNFLNELVESILIIRYQNKIKVET